MTLWRSGSEKVGAGAVMRTLSLPPQPYPTGVQTSREKCTPRVDREECRRFLVRVPTAPWVVGRISNPSLCGRTDWKSVLQLNQGAAGPALGVRLRGQRGAKDLALVADEDAAVGESRLDPDHV